MSAQIQDQLARLANPHGEVHVLCVLCYPDASSAKGLCGTRLRGISHSDDEPTTCSICADLEGLPCPECGI